MPTTKSAQRDLTDEEYRRQCTLRNPAFIKEREVFQNRWTSEPDLFAEAIVVARTAKRGQGIEAIKEQQRKQGRFFHELTELRQRWPSIAPGDIDSARVAAGEPGPKVQVVFELKGIWPRDGSVRLRVDPTTTGDEIKQQWQKIKDGLRLTEHRVRRGQQTLKLQIYDMRCGGDKTLSQIATGLIKPISTVYRLFVAVCRDIGNVREKGHADPSFDEREHWDNCSLCQKGGLCSLAEKKLGLKETSRKEITFPTVDHISPESFKGRKPRLKIKY